MAVTEQELRERLAGGWLVEHAEQMTEDYRQTLIRILTVSADTELISAPSYYRAARQAPTTNNLISALGIIQDELGHAHIAYRLLRDIGVDTEALLYDRRPEQFKHPYAFDVPLDRWEELIVANTFYDRAGYILLGDVYKSTSFGPWKRALVKVDKEETFHLRHGEQGMARLCQSAEGRARIQAAVDWMFPLTVEWFGLPDDLKHNVGQLTYGLKGSSNDTLRQEWLSTAVPFCEKVGIHVPAHHDAEQGKYVVDFPFPCTFDAERKQWDFGNPCTWDDVLKRWRARGPANHEFVGAIQRGHHELRGLLAA
ncbi:MAG: Phenylacetic acid catabolic protein [Roseiflexaceae bacterium]